MQKIEIPTKKYLSQYFGLKYPAGLVMNQSCIEGMVLFAQIVHEKRKYANNKGEQSRVLELDSSIILSVAGYEYRKSYTVMERGQEVTKTVAVPKLVGSLGQGVVISCNNILRDFFMADFFHHADKEILRNQKHIKVIVFDFMAKFALSDDDFKFESLLRTYRRYRAELS